MKIYQHKVLRMRNISGNFVVKIKTRFMFKTPTPKIVPFMR